LDAVIDKAGAVYDNLLVELKNTELDIMTMEDEITKMERDTSLISEIIKTLDKEVVRVLELKLVEGKSYEDIGLEIKKSTSAVRRFYQKSIYDICDWLKYMKVI
jgi:DNA-directed RNA polymerase specialized sigma24 family protein